MVLRQLFTAIGVTAAAIALALTAATAVAAAPAEAPAPAKSRVENTGAPDAAAEPRTCRARFGESVNHRLRAETGSQIIGAIPADTWVQASCDRVAGGEYDACGVASGYWLEVYWNGNWGHGAWGCVKDWEFTSLPKGRRLAARTCERGECRSASRPAHARGREAPRRLPASLGPPDAARLSARSAAARSR